MKYYSEDDVMDLIREAEDCERAYEWGEGHRRIHFEDYHSIEIPDKHGRLIDYDWVKNRKAELEKHFFNDEEALCMAIDEAPTIVEAST